MHFVSFWSRVGLASVAGRLRSQSKDQQRLSSFLFPIFPFSFLPSSFYFHLYLRDSLYISLVRVYFLSLSLLALAPLALAQSTTTVAVPTGTANGITLLTNTRHPLVANYSTTTYTDPRTGTNHTITYTLSSTNNVIYQDDINWGPLSLLREWSSNSNPGRPSKRGFGVVTARAWPDATVVYRYDSCETKQLLQGIVDSAIKEWKRGDPFLTFKELAPSPYDENANGILTITKHDPGSYWCWANAAWAQGNTGLRMNLQWLNADSTGSCGQDIGVAVHELGHVLGLMHEHMRPDRASHVKLDCTKYSPWTIAGCPSNPRCCPGDPFDACCADLHQFDLVPNPIYAKYGSYDCQSTMHYPSSPLLQGLPGCSIAPSSLPTQGDFDAVCQIYQAQCTPWKNVKNCQVNNPSPQCGTCNPISDLNKCDISTSCISTGTKFHCACRAGFKAAAGDADVSKHFRLPWDNYRHLVFVPENTPCNTLCDNPHGFSPQLCAEVKKQDMCPL